MRLNSASNVFQFKPETNISQSKLGFTFLNEAGFPILERGHMYIVKLVVPRNLLVVLGAKIFGTPPSAKGVLESTSRRK